MGPGPGLCLLLLRTSALALPLSRMGLVLSDLTRTATSAECSRGGCIVQLEPERTNEPNRLPPRHCKPHNPIAAEASCKLKLRAVVPAGGE
ncbi:hypothetical protein DFH08DRAFT_856156 [Mycena albidolilacea]|uniref:Secreted protein n=1 Tax=Mycena albidolilacea TaxID=1033008 RepID=A0AAD7AA09_9AGAR|nr:hypothetical protein DFH08DRAFT_856156 [Mycena albidolilacea]